MNNNEHQIHYTINKDGYCDTQCPHHHDFLLHVGGRTCHECPFFVCQSYCEKYVICSHPDNTTNKDIEQKQQEQ